MARENIELNENALKLVRKCEEDKEIASEGMGACQVMLEEMDKGNMDVSFMDMDIPGETYMEMAQKIKPQDVPQVLKMAFKMKENPNVEPGMKVAANRLIRAIEAL
ncbi:MAG TPA: hypothetical protein VK426_04985 [Methanobacterium sp.]|nr:hypothetical protein [Methanobacterium sp.]